MGIITREGEQVYAVAPSRLYKAMVLDFSNVLPKVAPHLIKSIEVEGEGPGSIRKVISVEGQVKQKVDFVEAGDGNYRYHYSVVEGGVLLEEPKLEKVSYEYKLETSPDGGSIIKGTAKFFTKGDENLTEEFLKANHEKTSGMLKAVVSYLLANPDQYN